MKKNKGFTLIELIVVITIISTLATTALATVGQYTRKARASADVYSARMIYDAVAKSIALGQLNFPSPPGGGGTNIDITIADQATTSEPDLNLVSNRYLNTMPEIKGLSDADKHWIILRYSSKKISVGVCIDSGGGFPSSGAILYPKPSAGYNGASIAAGSFESPPYNIYKLLN